MGWVGRLGMDRLGGAACAGPARRRGARVAEGRASPRKLVSTATSVAKEASRSP